MRAGDQEPNEVTYARGRQPGRTYLSKTFSLQVVRSRDFRQPARFAWKVFDEDEGVQPEWSDLERTEEIVLTMGRARKQIRLQVARESGQVREVLIQRVPADPSAGKLETLLRLDRSGATRLVDLIRLLDLAPVEKGEPTVRVDGSLVRDVLADPSSLDALYRQDPERVRELISSDTSARDLVAVARRREVVRQFRTLLSDSIAFDKAAARAGGKENVWQRFLEENPWILGVSLAGPLLTSWDRTRLEQVVAGFNVAHRGKRTDALLQTNGAIRSLVFAEIKHHETPLLGVQYRPGAWAPSQELSGGVAQLQQTVHSARRDLGDWLASRDDDGADTGEVTSLVRPRSYLIAGQLNELRGGQGGVHQEKHRSYELYRRNLYEPEIITFDELLARAEWHVSVAEPD